MSPEQALGDDDLDERTDVWSLGVVLYEALSGKLPFGDKLPLGQAIMAICSEPPPPLTSIAPWVPAPVATIVHRALAKRREDRFATIAQMLEAIRGELPDGDALDLSMLRGLSDEERAAAGAPAQAEDASSTGSRPPAMTFTSTDAAAAREALGSIMPPAPTSTLVPREGPRTRSARLATWAAMALMAGGLVIAGVSLARGPAEAQPAPAPLQGALSPTARALGAERPAPDALTGRAAAAEPAAPVTDPRAAEPVGTANTTSAPLLRAAHVRPDGSPIPAASHAGAAGGSRGKAAIPAPAGAPATLHAGAASAKRTPAAPAGAGSGSPDVDPYAP